MKTKANMKSNICRLLSLNLEEKPAARPASPLKRNRKEDVQEMRSKELTLRKRLSNKQNMHREKMVITVIETGKKYLELKTKTIELAVRMFDYYTFLLAEGFYFDSKKVQKGNEAYMLLDDKQERHLSLIACIFSSAKYYEIYPPGLSDFLYYFSGCNFTKQQVIRKQIDILRLTNFAFTISNATDWYEYYYDEAFPSWGIDCYTKWYSNMEDIARAVRETEREENAAKEVSTMQRCELMLKMSRKLLQAAASEVRQSDEQTQEQ